MAITRLCGLSVLLTAVALSGCSSLQGKSNSKPPDSGTTASVSSTNPISLDIEQPVDALGLDIGPAISVAVLDAGCFDTAGRITDDEAR